MNPYEILGLAPDADRPAIKAAYFRLIKIHSPDKDPERFKEIRRAYEELSTRSASGSRRLRVEDLHIPMPQQVLAAESGALPELTLEQLLLLTL